MAHHTIGATSSTAVGMCHSPAVEIDPGDTVTFEINEVTSWPVESVCLPLSVGVSSAPLP